MLETIKKYISHPWLRQLRDIQSLGLIVFAVIVVLVSISGVRTIQTNYKLEQQITDLQQQNNVQELKNSNQKLRNEYYKTPQYLELAARQNFGLAAPGETILLVPKDVAMKYVAGVSVDTALPTTQVSTADKKLPFYQRNMQAWINFFLHRVSTD